MTAEQFESALAERFGLTRDDLRALGRVVVPCDCGVDSCSGWQSVSREVAARALLSLHPHKPRPSDEGRGL